MLFTPEKLSSIYWFCGILGTVVFILKTAIPIDTGAEVTGDFNAITDTDSSFSLFTIESIAAFFMCGGWMGWYTYQLGYEIKFTILISILSGFLGMFLFAWLLCKLKNLEHSPKADIKELIGKKGKAYMNFSPKGSSKIQIEFASKLQILDAKNISDTDIKAFEDIKVVKVENDEVYIEKD